MARISPSGVVILKCDTFGFETLLDIFADFWANSTVFAAFSSADELNESLVNRQWQFHSRLDEDIIF